jgi:hypothetical protein
MTTVPVNAARQRAVNIIPQSDIPTLSPSHLDSLRGSGISDDIIRERGYRTVACQSDLMALGFSARQAAAAKNGHVLVIPLYGVDGGICGYIARPDSPRIDLKSGKAHKYEFPPKAQQILDVPVGCRDKISNPSIPLFITEGAKKADAAVSAGLTCIDLAGVWNWRGTNTVGGSTALGDWELVALNDRQIYIVFDSDVTIKVGVWLAAYRLGKFLRSKRAHVSYLVLPPLEDGSKCGLDDWLVGNNHNTDALLNFVRNELPPDPRTLGTQDADNQILGEIEDESGHWIARRDGMWIQKEIDDPVEGITTILTPLANFSGRIIGSITRNDGAEVRHQERVEWRLKDCVVTVDADGVDMLEHPDRVARDALGPGAITMSRIPPKLLGEVVSRFSTLSPIADITVYTHLGWEQVDGTPVYLSSGVAIDANGINDDVCVEAPSALRGFKLPPPPDNPVPAIRAVLELLNVAPDHVMIPLLGAVFRAPIGGVDWSLALSGHTGVRKSTLAALAQAFWMPSARYDNLPCSFMGTANSIADLEFLAADTLLVVDEYTPRGSDGEQARYSAAAERVLRGASNHSSRTRMRPDGTLRPDRPPKSLVVITGEEDIEGESLRARTVMVDIEPGDVPVSNTLNVCQKQAQVGTYTSMMASWILYIASRTPTEIRQQIDSMPRFGWSTGHDRSSRNLDDVAHVWLLWLDWVTRFNAIEGSERVTLFDRVVDAIDHLAAVQKQHVSEASISERFIRLLTSALNAGVVGITPLGTITPNMAGWTEAIERGKTSVGWISDREIWIDPGTAIAVAKEQARKEGQPLAATHRSIAADLHRARLFLDVDPSQYSVRRRVFGRRVRVWVLAADTLMGEVSPTPHNV